MTAVEKICRECGNTFTLIPGIHKVKKRIFCSRACARPHLSRLAKLRIGENGNNWKGGERFEPINGRFIVRKNKRDIPRARAVVEAKIGRNLESREIVHHIDGVKTNDVVTNLFLFRHQPAHVRWHTFIRRHGLSGQLLQSNI